MKTFKSHQLKIKVVSLGLEAALIHREENKLKGQITRCKVKIAELTAHINNGDVLADVMGEQRDECRKTLVFLRSQRDSLREHRKRDIRPLTRCSGLAYGFLRGKAYKQIEPKRYSDPDWNCIERMVAKHGPREMPDLKARFAEWRAQAGEKAVQP